MNLAFTKMQALGNDFVVLDFTRHAPGLSPEQARFIADRHFGIGCDQILIIAPSEREHIDFRYRILNADGSEVGQCGNGARCFALYVYERGLTDKTTVEVETQSGDMTLELNPENNQVAVNMGVPKFEPQDIPFIPNSEGLNQQQAIYELSVNDEIITLSAVSMGNPHAVIRVDDIDTAPVTSLGALLESDSRFPERVNVGFMQVLDRETIRLRVFERGAGETLACGSGACAAVVCGQQNGWLDQKVTVQLRGGELAVDWSGMGEPVIMTGPTSFVYDGQIKL